ncbi:triacylglycerol lipase [Thozetella sp. PMI_491]|nr:triacylglycerol lipase [Thozetella sp. PMI_491]
MGAVLWCLVLAAPSACLVSCFAPQVTVKNGTYSGTYLPNFQQDAFLGMPYAQPPVGTLRFKPPVSLNTSWIGNRNATDYSPYCPGYNNDAANYQPSEDCLTINVIRPIGYDGQQLPVAVWIYGGGYFAGGSADPRYNLSYIVAASVQMGKPMVAISMNYRLAGWGFMKSSDLVAEGSTNMGMRDQRLALHWIQENVAAFGGNPSKVTIWGESAGAFSVGFHLVAYGGRDDSLFRGAIAESGNPLYLGHPTWKESQAYYDNITALTGCTDATDTLECLRSVPFETLDEIFANTWKNIFFPQPDGDFIQGSTMDQMLSGQFVKTPLLIGCNTDEGTAFLPGVMNTDQDLIDYILTQGPDETTALDLLKLYPDIPAVGIPDSVTAQPNSSVYGFMYKRAAAYNGDYYFIAGRRFTAAQWALHNTSSYSYRFNTAHYNGGPDFASVTHGRELAYVFGAANAASYSPNPFQDMPASYYELSVLIQKMWVSFVNDLNPNAHGVKTQPTWPAYVATDGYGQNFVFDANLTNYVELDTFRASGIAYLHSVWKSQYGY